VGTVVTEGDATRGGDGMRGDDGSRGTGVGVAHGFDVSFVREVPITPAQLWQGWTDRETLLRWFTPAPWVTTDAEIDPRPGGIFRTEMRGPAGERNGGTGCVLEAVRDRRFVWTSALGPGYAPVARPEVGFLFTAVLEFAPAPAGATYRATARHTTQADADEHARMGFEAGWSAALAQLVALFG